MMLVSCSVMVKPDFHFWFNINNNQQQKNVGCCWGGGGDYNGGMGWWEEGAVMLCPIIEG